MEAILTEEEMKAILLEEALLMEEKWILIDRNHIDWKNRSHIDRRKIGNLLKQEEMKAILVEEMEDLLREK